MGFRPMPHPMAIRGMPYAQISSVDESRCCFCLRSVNVTGATKHLGGRSGKRNMWRHKIIGVLLGKSWTWLKNHEHGGFLYINLRVNQSNDTYIQYIHPKSLKVTLTGIMIMINIDSPMPLPLWGRMMKQ